MINLMFGARRPSLEKLLVEEIEKARKGDEPKLDLDPSSRSPEEEIRWRREEEIRISIERKERLKAETEEQHRHEKYLEFMAKELREETILILHPWVFLDEDGSARDKHLSPPYTELIREILRQKFEVQEERMLQLDEETIQRIFRNFDPTPELTAALLEGTCMAIRIRCKMLHDEWTVSHARYSREESKEISGKPIDEVEDILWSLIAGDGQSKTDVSRETVPYIERHIRIHESELEGTSPWTEHAVWTPLQAKLKVQAFDALFPDYMESFHPYSEPEPQPPICAFKFRAEKFTPLKNICALLGPAILRFGAFEFDDPKNARCLANRPEDFEKKVLNHLASRRTRDEIFVVILKRMNEETFLTLADVGFYYMTEEETEVWKIMKEYFAENIEVLTSSDEGDEDEGDEMSEENGQYYYNYENVEN
ncbi:hypothetical protein KM043_015741 [Ampulex compressa]|nr:hypothetical protein KM043_015741 [Ampulex compressa]